VSSYNIYGGTPQKTLALMKYFGNRSAIYVYDNAYPEFKRLFELTSGKIYEGFYKRNIFKHIKVLLKIIGDDHIDIVQTQFTMGEALGFLIKLFRPKVKLLVTFEGSLPPTGVKKFLANMVFYKKADGFIFISNYVKIEKVKQFPSLDHRFCKVIYNGAEERINFKSSAQINNHTALLAVSSLIELKNIQVVIEALNFIINHWGKENMFFYVAGDGPMREELKKLVNNLNLNNHVSLLGNQKNVGQLLDDCDIFVHPAYAEGFGIAVVEAMMAKKPIIVSNAGALPELIEHEVSGLVIDPFGAKAWALAILELTENKVKAEKLGLKARDTAVKAFSVDKFCQEYKIMYQKLGSASN
jgi:glycosyltransferase involved in cell wall biosynthesis